MAAMTRDELLKQIGDNDEKVRTQAWLHAGEAGPAALAPLVAMLADEPSQEVCRAATRACWQIVRHAARPGADAERKEAAGQLLMLLGKPAAPQTERDLLWMLSECAGEEAVAPVATLLGKPDLREDARMVLQRLGGDGAIRALKAAIPTSPPEFRPALADSLAKLDVAVSDVPSERLKPAKETSVKPVGR